ncbi:hypothetical protein A3C86_03285 [Candidatus Kaiserbacteria bacterium RIFCSPHIGHO2_02_FULL_49_16]|uniref:Uncharacterized protein n=1 Tax=Candidatus Kaiserbacteria bacterium RIFCSPHIGHO2_02_FULL_49_16 TaxID=1798490 RepID=A0A1F6DGA7_9BACT|nr:MAG: hypothetical protein A3C86_03285 [Candidatus Kaiserbacteria bacterium RIFCSPHIGHO2_02_FULL_49_16]
MDDLKSGMREKALTYIGGAFGLVAGLAWNDAIKELIQYLFPLATDTLTAKFVYAGLITVVVVIIITYLEKIFNSKPSDTAEKSEKNENESG